MEKTHKNVPAGYYFSRFQDYTINYLNPLLFMRKLPYSIPYLYCVKSTLTSIQLSHQTVMKSLKLFFVVAVQFLLNFAILNPLKELEKIRSENQSKDAGGGGEAILSEKRQQLSPTKKLIKSHTQFKKIIVV